MRTIQLFVVTTFAATAAFFFTPHATAATFAETGDAGATLATAQNTGTATAAPLTAVSGTISTGVDADVFKIQITNTATFSATSDGGSNLDTKLFLFDSAGNAVYANDDADGLSLQSTLPAGNSLLTSRAAGTYFLAVALSGNEPVNTPNQLLFIVNPNGDPTAVAGPASGLNPTTLNNFNNNTSFAETGPYAIALTGAATFGVPEPSTLSLAAVGVAAIVRRRRA